MAKKNTDGMQHMPPKILELSVHNDNLEIGYIDRVIIDGKEIVNNQSPKLRHEPHQDLVDKMDSLSLHLAFLCDQENDAMDKFQKLTPASIRELQERYTFRGVTITRKDEAIVSVRLKGYRKLRSKQVLNLLAPKVKFQSEGEAYEYADDMEEIIAQLLMELVAYIAGKRAEEGQITLGFETAEPDETGEPKEDDGQ